jgi:nitrile hydratase
LRTPGYVFGQRGVVTRSLGLYPDPGLAAFRLPTPKVPLYSVRISLRDIRKSRYYRDDEEEQEEGVEGDAVELDVFQPWLERVEEEGVSASASDGKGEGLGPSLSGLESHVHDHDHDHDHDHVHSSRSETERLALQREGPGEALDRPGRRLAEALLSLLERKGLVLPAQLTSTIERLESRGREMKGADLVVAAWMDAAFKKELLEDATAAALRLGIVASSDAATKLVVCENTPTTHHVIVCTLCSCYPSALLGLSPAWYRSSSYRARVVRQPRQVLLESFGTALPPSQQIVVHDSTADCRYMVLPMRPAGAEGLDRAALRALVTRDSLLGVRVLL